MVEGSRRRAARCAVPGGLVRERCVLVWLASLLLGLAFCASASAQPQSSGGAASAKSAPASAGKKGAERKKGRVVTISEVTIVGRIQKPIAAVDVSRIQPRLTLKELRQPFLRRIRKATFRAPF